MQLVIEGEEMRPRTHWCVDFQKGGDSSQETWGTQDRFMVAADDPRANAVSSQLDNGMHAPAIDIDMPCKLVESKTPGHFHLYIDKEMSWEQYQTLLSAMVTAGIVERGYLSASRDRKQTFLRKTA